MSSDPTVRIGVHPYNLSLVVLRLRGLLPERLAPHGARVEWVEFEDGCCTVDLIGDGTIDLGGSGSVPPLLAQAEGLPVVYVAASAPRPRHGVLVTRRGSGITGAADLAHRSVALMDGSFHTDVLARALDGVGVAYRQVDVVDGLVDEGMELFLAGEVDAWFGNDPYLARVRAALGDELVDVLASGALTTNRSIWYAASGFAEREPAVLATLVGALRDCLCSTTSKRTSNTSYRRKTSGTTSTRG
jgi:sulfonate transport system substrate-binding protein